MVLENISILNYKNLRDVRLSFSPNINCLIGLNGAGKTNLLDAVYYLSFCRSSSNALDSSLILHGEKFFSIEGVYSDGEEERKETINCAFSDHHKVVRRNKKAYRRLSEHIGLLPLILVTPQDVLLVEAGSEARRSFMDVVIAQYDPLYVAALAKYNKALQQRNAMLRSEQELDISLIEIWEKEMAVNGEAVYTKRAAFIEEFIPHCQKIYSSIAEGKETIAINYLSHAQRGELLATIQEGRAKDRIIGHSLHGIHRDDLELLLDGYNIKREGSQGQSKTLLLAMKLAQFELLRHTVSRTTPLLLLDDIFDKLDAKRVGKIVELVASDAYGQIFITDTHRDHLQTLLPSSTADYSLFNVEDGVISTL